MGIDFNDRLSAQLDYRGLRAAFAPEAIYQAFLDVERAVALAQGKLGMIPANSAAAIAAACNVERLDRSRIEMGFATTRHPLMPLINELVRVVGEPHGGYVHWGITTQNVIQSGILLLAQRAQATLDELLSEILAHLGRHARAHATTTMAGRTHYRHAVPITFGFKVAVWIDELLQAIDRLNEVRARAFVVMSGGAVGCFSALGPQGPAFQREVAQLLGMGEMAIPSRAIRTHMCDYMNALGLAAAVCHRIAEEVYQTSAEEYDEIHEGRVAGSIGSSTMPQKINPILAYGIIAGAERLYALAGMLMSLAHRPFESDGSANQIFEDAMPDAIGAMADVLVRTEAMLRDLVVDPARMLVNLNLSHGAIHGELAMMQLGRTLGKHTAHEKVHDIAVSAADGGRAFMEQIASLPGGGELRAEIDRRLSGGGSNGICAEYALHFGALAERAANGTLPTPAERLLHVEPPC
ncbi:lyase family protein [Paracoccus sp. MBLB3053]|uniref:Lyase family protein n=1 Tax=Paracoccus aurantius TaxID=3073814 RepID=A0ABU2HTQ2_9RHOB|nr:lyase family protein [Paracoccus sp. MBLB3053]MDS9467915.1 lyase family protein [Paracoccus sp. MBLB3053]